MKAVTVAAAAAAMEVATDRARVVMAKARAAMAVADTSRAAVRRRRYSPSLRIQANLYEQATALAVAETGAAELLVAATRATKV